MQTARCRRANPGCTGTQHRGISAAKRLGHRQLRRNRLRQMPHPSAAAKPAPAPAPAKAPPAAVTAPKSDAQRGRLVLRTTPSGASVEINGKVQGTTPLTLQNLPFGILMVRLERAGYQPLQRRVVLNETRPVENLTLPLVKTPGPRPRCRHRHLVICEVENHARGRQWLSRRRALRIPARGREGLHR